MSPSMRQAGSLLAGLLCLAVVRDAAAITRTEVITTAKAFVYHPWRCTSANLTASCSSAYHSDYVPGDYLGLPYDWGGCMNLFQFDQQIAQGYGAGSPVGGDVLDCTAGVDCSGFVSQCLHVSYHTTDMMADISSAITQQELLAGDIINKSGYHVVLFSHLLGSGEPYIYESSPPNTRANPFGGWSYLNGYTPRRYEGITGSSAGNPVGTLGNPIKIGAFPYTDSRDTSQSSSDVFDGCSLAPSTKETGPEYVYEVTFTQPGSLTVSVSDDVGVDIDVHLYGSRNTGDCLARHDTNFTVNVDCGTYYIVADTFAGTTESPGAYTLNVTFAPSGGACGNGPPTYDPAGGLGEHCTNAFPYCNTTLGAEVCILTNPESDSFCSTSCKTSSDCAVFPGGCCVELGNPGSGDFYCLKSAYCGGTGGSGGSPGTGGSGQGGAGQGGAGQGGTGQGGTQQQGGSSGGPGSGGSTSQGGAPGAGGSGTGGDPSGEGGAPDSAQAAPAGEDSGCGCRTAPQSPHGFTWLAALGLLAIRRRRQRGSR